MHGLLSKKTNNIIIKEIKLIEHHSSNATSTTCLMTCYFDYVKRGKLEMLTGTYTSINTDGSTVNNCGEGTVYLEKVEDHYCDQPSRSNHFDESVLKSMRSFWCYFFQRD